MTFFLRPVSRKKLFLKNLITLGSFNKPNFKGYIKANNSSFDVPYLGVRYSFPENPSFILDKMSIYMDNFKIVATNGIHMNYNWHKIALSALK